MPNDYGALSLAEMRDRVWRRINAIRNTTLEPGNTEVPASQQLDPLVTKEDLNMYLSSSLTMRFIDITDSSPEVFSDLKKIDVEQNKVEYALPDDIAFLRAVYWKDALIPASDNPDSKRVLMYEFDADTVISLNLNARQVPTYHRRLSYLVLNQIPQVDNPEGIEVEYVKQILPLIEDDQYLEFQLGNMLQEVMIADAVVEITEERMQLDATMLKNSRDLKLQRLMQAAVMQKLTKSNVLFVAGYEFSRPSSAGRWRRA